MVEFERRPRIATLAAGPDERAPAAIALPHRALHLQRDVTRVLAAATAAGTVAPAELLLLEPGFEAVHGEIEQLIEVRTGVRVCEQRLHDAQLLLPRGTVSVPPAGM